jgi:YDG domain
VGQRALTGTIVQGNTIYGDPLVAGQASLSNVVGTDKVNVTGVTIDTTGKTSTSGKLKAGTHTGVQSVAGIDGVDAGNYTFANVKGDYKVDPKLITTALISDAGNIYGGAVSSGSVNLGGDVVQGDRVLSVSSVTIEGRVLSSSGNLKAGTYVQSVGGGLSGADAGNYSFGGTSSANYVVNKLALTTQIAGVNTTYGTDAATGSASISGVLLGDKVDLANAKATLVDAVKSSSGQLKAGTYKQTVANSLSGADADNYTAAPTSVANYVVTPKAIVATVQASDKEYDGSNLAALNASSADILSGDVVNVLGVTGTFASKNVARDGSGNVVAQTVTVAGTGVGLGGADGANYTLTNATSIPSTTAKITPKGLTVSGITASDKVYDGNTTAAISTTNAALAGVVSGDGVSVSSQGAAGNFASKDVAFDSTGAVASQAVKVTGLSLSGADAGNYTVTDQSGAVAKVQQRPLSIAGSVAQDKTVDGTTLATVKAGQLVNLVAGESLVVTATGQFADAEIGTNKAVATQYALANGTNGKASNYIKPNAEVLRAAILAATVNPVQPIVSPTKPGGGGRVVVAGSSSSGAALGVAGDEEPIGREECSVLNPEKCECQESTIAGVELCFAPGLVVSSKD